MLNRAPPRLTYFDILDELCSSCLSEIHTPFDMIYHTFDVACYARLLHFDSYGSRFIMLGHLGPHPG